MCEDIFPEELAISVREVSKTYRLGVINRRTFRDELVYRYLRLRGMDPRKTMGRIDGNETAMPGLFHALENVSFDIRKGETVGLIGRNGAGKSTMLKILARTTTPSTGDVWIRGRVGSLLEVGTGFHPELTGRENIYLNGTILGMSKSEIDAKFDEIVEFSEIGEFLDTPVKRYSSGMYVKLAFSVASSLDTDILLLDEVLAVGDAAFRRKSLARMKQIADSGRTILFVSHSMGDIKSICSRCIWFNKGQVLLDGGTKQLLPAYEEASVFPFLSPKDVCNPVRKDGTIPVCRFRSAKTGRHFLTARRLEMRDVYQKSDGWLCDGPVFRVFAEPRAGTVPLLRFCSTATGVHVYIADPEEGQRFSSDSGTWRRERTLGYVWKSCEPGSVPVYRMDLGNDLGFQYRIGDEAFPARDDRPANCSPLRPVFFALPENRR